MRQPDIEIYLKDADVDYKAIAAWLGAALGQGLVGRNAGGDQQQTVQPQDVHSRPGRRQMAPVDGVEGAAVDADLHTLRFLSFSSSIFRLSLLC